MIVQDHVVKELRQELGNVKEKRSALPIKHVLAKAKKIASVLHGVAKVRQFIREICDSNSNIP